MEGRKRQVAMIMQVSVCLMDFIPPLDHRKCYQVWWELEEKAVLILYPHLSRADYKETSRKPSPVI